MTLLVAILASFMAGVICGGAYASFQIGKREASRRDLAAELRSPVDADFETIRRIAEGA